MTSTQPRLTRLIGPDSPHDKPWVRLILVSTVHGSATLNGTSKQLGNDLDSQLLMGLRDWADVVLVGSATVKAEGYGGTPSRPVRQSPAPIAVLSRSLDLDPQSAFFTSAHTPPIIACPSSSLTNPELQSRRRALVNAGAQLLDCGDGSAGNVLSSLRASGYLKVSCEGGPSVYSSLIESQLFDQLYLTIDPHVGSYVEQTVVRYLKGSDSTTTALRLHLEHSEADDDSTVFLRYGASGAL